MAGQGKWFVQYAAQHHVDLGLLIGIAGAETTWGDAGTGVRGQYNPFGFMRSGPGTGLTFGSYKEAISRMAALMSKSYRQFSKPGQANPKGMMMKYVGYSSGDWLQTASHYANSLGNPKGGGGGAVPTGEPAIVKFAKSFLGIPYVYAGASRKGVDCSGFVMLVYQHFGIHALDSHYTGTQITKGKAVSRANLQPGDLVFTHPDSNGTTGHVMMYIGNGKIIEAAHTGTDVRIMNLSDRDDDVVGYRRYTNKPNIVGPSRGGGGGGGQPGRPVGSGKQQQVGFTFPQPTEDLVGTGVLEMPGMNPGMQQEPESVTNMWQSLANLPNASPESLTFANRANAWGG